MSELKKGDKVLIHCYKHNGVLYKIWKDSIVLENKDGLLVVGNNNALVTKNDGRVWNTKEPSIMFFYPDKWYNIIAQLKEKGLFYKCDIASPYIIDDNIIKFIDYDLDLKVFPDGAFRVLDRNEYNYHKSIMNYSKEIDMIIKHSLTELINRKRKNENPFNKRIVNYYYNIYKQIKNI